MDLLLVERGLAESRQRAQALVLAGEVQANGQRIDKAGSLVPDDAEITVRTPLKYVSRGGLKLEGALDDFRVEVSGRACADLGASTGGFTDCLLKRGAARVYAVDVGYGQLAWKLRQDPRVIVMDRVNIRFLETLPEAVDLVTIDTSFISLTLILPTAMRILRQGGDVVGLVKPQFEAGRGQVGKGGIVRDAQVHRAVLDKIGQFAKSQGWQVRGFTRSRLEGAEGNAEFFIHLVEGHTDGSVELEPAITQVLSKE